VRGSRIQQNNRKERIEGGVRQTEAGKDRGGSEVRAAATTSSAHSLRILERYIGSQKTESNAKTFGKTRSFEAPKKDGRAPQKKNPDGSVQPS